MVAEIAGPRSADRWREAICRAGSFGRTGVRFAGSNTRPRRQKGDLCTTNIDNATSRAGNARHLRTGEPLHGRDERGGQAVAIFTSQIGAQPGHARRESARASRRITVDRGALLGIRHEPFHVHDGTIESFFTRLGEIVRVQNRGDAGSSQPVRDRVDAPGEDAGARTGRMQVRGLT